MDNKVLIPPPKSGSRSFTLIEIIIVIIIVGILAALGISQYSLTAEKSRLAEAKIRIGAMRQLAYEYWLENGTFVGIQSADVGIDGMCHSTDFYSYWLDNTSNPSVYLGLVARRCTSGGKTPDALRAYDFFQAFYPGTTGESKWFCHWVDDDLTGCLGLPPNNG